MTKKRTSKFENADGPLRDSPFADLGAGMLDDLPQGPAPNPPHDTAPAFRVQKTKKGNWPLSVEKRAAGKVVTIVGNVSGDADALLSKLKKRCGAGGVTRNGAVEIQGDQCAAIERFLSDTFG